MNILIEKPIKGLEGGPPPPLQQQLGGGPPTLISYKPEVYIHPNSLPS